MNGDTSLENVAEFFSFMGIIRVGFPAWLQCEQYGLHHVFLGGGDDPLDFIFQFRIVFLKIVRFAEDNLFLRRFIEEFADGGSEALEDIHQSGDGWGG